METFSKLPDDTCGAWVSTSAPLDTAERIIRRGQTATALLLEAFETARELDRDKWDFAVEIETLRKAGMTDSDFRWLICKEYAEHAREITTPGDEGRAFLPNRGLSFHRRTCFVLRETGLPFFNMASYQLQCALRKPLESIAAAVSAGALPAPSTAGNSPIPKWDSDRQELRFNSQLVKQFKVPAVNQEMILAVFEEENWPPRIDDPLPPQPAHDPKRRLHDSINSLNRNQKSPLIRFLGDGKGTGVRWEPVSERDLVARAANGSGSH